MDISVITTPDSRWNNYYLEGLDWMIKNLGLDGVYIDDSALDHQTLQRARRIMDADGKRRLIDIHSWNHMNQWAGYANSLHLYLMWTAPGSVKVSEQIIRWISGWWKCPVFLSA